jgi:hypothetical protein
VCGRRLDGPATPSVPPIQRGSGVLCAHERRETTVAGQLPPLRIGGDDRNPHCLSLRLAAKEVEVELAREETEVPGDNQGYVIGLDLRETIP